MGFTLDVQSERALRGVNPDLVRVVRTAASISPIPFRCTEGLRTLERQKQLKAQGMSKTLNSRHLTGHAVDLVPIVDVTGDGKVTGEDMWHHAQLVKLSPYIRQAFKQCGVPCTWGGDWKNGWDKPHWELPWKQYPIRTASMGDLDLMEALTEDPYGDVNFTPSTKALATSGVIGLSGAGVLVDAANQLSQAEHHFNAGNAIGMLIGALLVGGAAIDLYSRWDAAGRPLPWKKPVLA
jgi:peptidoglycan L-alanyl-D-glutamate endopeptidase CwlK